jgi:hypothetical protein
MDEYDYIDIAVDTLKYKAFGATEYVKHYCRSFWKSIFHVILTP